MTQDNKPERTMSNNEEVAKEIIVKFILDFSVVVIQKGNENKQTLTERLIEALQKKDEAYEVRLDAVETWHKANLHLQIKELNRKLSLAVAALEPFIEPSTPEFWEHYGGQVYENAREALQQIKGE